MLSAAGRAALQRLGARASSRTPVLSKLTAPAAQWQALKSLQTVRLYAATSHPAKTPTAKTLTTKKPAAKKTTVKKKIAKPKAKVAKKAPAAKKTIKAKKPVAKKLRAKKPVVKKQKKPVTEATLKRREVKTRQQLKKTALFTEPKPLPEFAFRAYVAEKLLGKSGDFKDQSAKLTAVAESFKSISEAEKQRYASIGEENQRANAVAYKAWVESHTLDQINAAINARLRLKREFNYPKGSPKSIKDERLPKRPISAFAYFTKAKWAAGDVKEGGNRAMAASAAAISADWKNLSASQRQPYEDLQRAESLRYEKDYEAAFGRKPEARKQSPEP